jgi:hypothetical protein
MPTLVAEWMRALGQELCRRRLEREILEFASRLDREPQQRSRYQSLVEEHSSLCCGGRHGAHANSFERPANLG